MNMRRLWLWVGMILMGAGMVLPLAAQRPGPDLWEPQIAIVWPHDGAGNAVPVTRATHVNVSIWPRNAVSCASNEVPTLSVGRGTEPLPVSATVTQQVRTVEGVTFPTVDYNDIRVEPGEPYRFFVAPSPVGPNSNVWVHATDARTFVPDPAIPVDTIDGEAVAGLAGLLPRIQVVWPHDAQGTYVPVSEADLVNVGVMLLDLLDRSVEVGYEEAVSLLVATNNAPLQVSPVEGVPVPIGLEGGIVYPTWQFNDISVSPGDQTHFLALTAGGAYSAPWTHAVDARTILPEPTLPPPCIPARE